MSWVISEETRGAGAPIACAAMGSMAGDYAAFERAQQRWNNLQAAVLTFSRRARLRQAAEGFMDDDDPDRAGEWSIWVLVALAVVAVLSVPAIVAWFTS
jgi:hypothetical protein